MRKHPVLYHQAVKHLAMPAPHLLFPMGNKSGYLTTIRQWYRILLILGTLQLLHSFTNLQGGQNSWHFTNIDNTVSSNRSVASSTPSAAHRTKQFSFEYDGLLQFRLIVTENTDNGLLPVIQITTTLHQPDR
ncbi:hypothetical protein [Paraflavitalea pollutisoli]|uniref:hypothetical protein n=1 Tax=Paraflavitalea pollutisoli TaxID=3034143 RepID=UPI0023EB4379|nr:hypothetical protein [Paraflavitalea sp. H1-2-19X]